MRPRMPWAVSLTLSVGVLVTTGLGQTAFQNSSAPTVTSIAHKQAPQFSFILFWKQQDAHTQQFAETLQSAVAKRSERANLTSVDIKDQANRAVVDHYGVNRAPMPLAVCVADNGAVTGVFTRRPNDEAVERALVTSAMAEVTKALQDKKIVVVHVKPTAKSSLPAGAVEFTADPAFRARTKIIDVVISDPNESRFLADMEISPRDVN
ncbi:MAG: hypothetical protein WD229_10160, partial [Pirellulales bacterium]